MVNAPPRALRALGETVRVVVDDLEEPSRGHFGVGALPGKALFVVSKTPSGRYLAFSERTIESNAWIMDDVQGLKPHKGASSIARCF